MEENIIRRAQVRGIKADLFNVALNDEELFAFAQKAFAIVKDFASLNPSTNPRLGLGEYTVDNIERLFKGRGKSADAEFSRFISLFACFRQAGEIELYREMYQYNINIKTAQIFVRFFLSVGDLHTHFYSNKSRLLQHIKLDTLRVKEMAASLLVKEVRVSIFNNLVLKHMEEHTKDVHKLHADIAARFLIQAYFYNNIKPEEGADNDDLLLNWNSQTPNVFEIKVKKQGNGNAGAEEDANGHAGHATEEGDASPAAEQREPQMLEQINTDFQKKNRPQKVAAEADHATASSKAPTTGYNTNGAGYATQGSTSNKGNLTKICYDYVVNHNTNAEARAKKAGHPSEEYSEATDQKLNKDLEHLRKELNRRKNEAEVEKSIWKLVLNNSKAAIKNYTELKKEIMITEGLADALLNIAEKGTPEWKALYDIRNHEVGELYRYKFLIAALLENCLQDLDSDIQGFKFGHDEPAHKMNKVLNKEGNFDLNDYLTNIYQTNKLFATNGSEPPTPDRLNKFGHDKNDHGVATSEDLAEPVIQQFKFPGKVPVRDDSADKQSAKKQVPAAATGPSQDIAVLTPEQAQEQKEKEEAEIREAIETKEISKLKSNLLKLKRELVYAPKKPPKVDTPPQEEAPPEEVPEPEPEPSPAKAAKGAKANAKKPARPIAAKSPNKGAKDAKATPKIAPKKHAVSNF